MFTGIIEEVGTVRSITKGPHSAVLHIGAKRVLEDVNAGDSIATNGVCLTVTSFDSRGFSADVMHETLNRSSLGSLRAGSKVNLERAMSALGRFGGHIVSGHIDGTGVIRSLKVDDNAVWYSIGASNDILKYVVEKGSITIDGISLTVAALDESGFSVSVIPHTRAETSLSEKRAGDVVNLEADVIGKYVERLMTFGSEAGQVNSLAQRSRETGTTSNSSSGITRDFLIKNGF